MSKDRPVFPNIPHYGLKDLVGKTLTICDLACAQEDSTIVAAVDISTGILYVLSVSIKMPNVVQDRKPWRDLKHTEEGVTDES